MSILFSDEVPNLGWSDAHGYAASYGPKGSMLLAVPRTWTPPFALVSADAPRDVLPIAPRVRTLVEEGGQLIVRSSVLGESIWDRGSYRSVNCDTKAEGFEERLMSAIDEVVRSASGKDVAVGPAAFRQTTGAR